MIRKRSIILIFVLILILNLTPNVFLLNAQEEVKVYLDGNLLETENNAIVIDGRVFLPVRDVVELLNGRIVWFPALKLLNIIMPEKEISVVIDALEAEVNKEKIELETPAKIIENRVMIPVEILKTLDNIVVEWDMKSKILNILRKGEFVNNVRSFTYDDKTRIVIDVTDSSDFKILKLDNPDRIVIDINALTRLKNNEQKEFLIDDNTVKKVRIGQFDLNTARIVLDLINNFQYEVFALKSPERIVVDVFNSDEIKQSDGVQVAIEAKPIEPSHIPATDIELDERQNEKHIIVIDPGHGGSHPGAIGPSGLKEKDIVLDVAIKLQKILQNKGYQVYLTREKDIDVPLEDRPLIAAKKEASAFISIHVNSALQKGSTTARGIETYVLNSRYIGASAKDVADRENKASQFHNYEDNVLNQIIADLEESASIGFSLDFADIVQKKLVQHTGLSSRGVKQAPFIVLKGVNMAAVLVEVGFISNPEEEKLLKTSEFREKVAQALGESVTEYIKTIPIE